MVSKIHSETYISLLIHYRCFLFSGKTGIFHTSNFVDGTFQGFGEVDVISKHQQKVSNIASTSTHIDDRLSPGNVTILSGETAMLACKIYNVGNKSVRFLKKNFSKTPPR